jgi:beta-galactosidase GanA
MVNRLKIKLVSLLFFSTQLISAQNKVVIPHLKKQGETTQLIVDEKPFLILGGELGNSTFTTVENMVSVWPKLKVMNLNTILAPVFWELIEPTESNFDFKVLDDLIYETRKNNLKLVLLWFGSWKNSMSSHAPAWIKTNQIKYPRAKSKELESQEILSPFSIQNLKADKNAFMALMQHLKEVDGEEHTVIMVQPENEIGMLPSARDYHPLATKEFKGPVPSELMSYLIKNNKRLVPEFRSYWDKNGFKKSGSWEEVFGKGDQTDEIFMSWYFAKYANEVTKAGKEVYPLPMFVNAALNAKGRKPGEYPSAGPLPHLMDVWKAGAPDLDFLAPDFYNPNFKYWNDLYTRQGNPLFIPEHTFDNTVAGKAAYAFGHYEAMGFSPFSIESVEEPYNEAIGKMYGLIKQLIPIITENQGYGRIEGVLLDKANEGSVIKLGDYEFTFNHSYKLGWEAEAKNETWDMAGAIIIQTDDKEFYVAGNGIYVTFKNLKKPKLNVGILKVDEGVFENGNWKILRHLNGDQTHQGRHLRIFKENYKIQRLELYNYE